MEDSIILDLLPYYILRSIKDSKGYESLLIFLKDLRERIQLQHYCDKEYVFHIKQDENNNVRIILTLNVVKGSLKSYIWNKFARIDDEYKLSIGIECGNRTILPRLTSVWHIFGINGFNRRVEDWNIDWNILKLLQSMTTHCNVGLTSFAKYFSVYLCTLPICIINRRLVEPMPISLMFVFKL